MQDGEVVGKSVEVSRNQIAISRVQEFTEQVLLGDLIHPDGHIDRRSAAVEGCLLSWPVNRDQFKIEIRCQAAIQSQLLVAEPAP